MNGSGKRKYPQNDAAIHKRGDRAECCQCCGCCGRKSKGWLLLVFTFLALLFSVGTLASPWYLIYSESEAATLTAYYHWSGQLRVTRGHDGALSDSTESLSWSDLRMPQTHTLFLTILVIAVTALALVIILAGCVLCMILLPAYNISSRFILSRSGIRKAKWKWTFSLSLLGCFLAQLLSFTLFLQLPQCFASDYDDHCSSNECANFIGGSRQKGGYMHIYTPFVGWCSAVISCMLVLVTAILFVAFFARKRPRNDRSHALAIINASDRSRSTTTFSMEPDDDEDAAERRPLLASEKAESARRAANKQHESPIKSGNSILHHRSVSARVSPNKVEDATIEECDSPLSYHNPCPTSPSLARILPLADLPASPNVTPRASAAANLEARFAATAADTVHSLPTIEEDSTQSKKNDLISEDNDTREAKATSSSDEYLAPDRTPDSADSEPEAQKQSFEEEISAVNLNGQAQEPSQVSDETISPALADVVNKTEAVIEQPSPAAKDEESGDKEVHSEEPKANLEESKTDAAQDIKPAKRRFATMQRLSYKDYAKQKPAAPTPESILGPSRVRGVPTNRLAMRTATRGAPLSSMRSQVHAPPSPSRSATVPLPAIRKPADLTPQSESAVSDELSSSPDSSSPTAETPPATDESAPSADDTDIS